MVYAHKPNLMCCYSQALYSIGGRCWDIPALAEESGIYPSCCRCMLLGGVGLWYCVPAANSHW